jgi:hypothetical protein
MSLEGVGLNELSANNIYQFTPVSSPFLLDSPPAPKQLTMSKPRETISLCPVIAGSLLGSLLRTHQSTTILAHVKGGKARIPRQDALFSSCSASTSLKFLSWWISPRASSRCDLE